MECYQNVRYDGYGKTHPAEAFACAFEILLRNGEKKLMNEYRQFHDVFTHLV
jgi:Mlc titration factor MtfA (ptsG expression regulator)